MASRIRAWLAAGAVATAFLVALPAAAVAAPPDTTPPTTPI